jgi:hypothetical protein
MLCTLSGEGVGLDLYRELSGFDLGCVTSTTSRLATAWRRLISGVVVIVERGRSVMLAVEQGFIERRLPARVLARIWS